VGCFVLVEARAAVEGEAVEVGAAVDDVAGPEEGVGLGVGDGAGLVACDGGFDVGSLSGEGAVFEEGAEEVKPIVDGVVVCGLERGSGVG
jgi:hypothetical protein